MKYLNRLKGMNKSAKLGLISTAVYAASTFAVPAYAAVKDNLASVEVVNLENVKSAKDADALLRIKLNEYSLDKKLNYEEVKNLHSILVKKQALFEVGLTVEEQYAKKVVEEVNVLQEKIDDLERKLGVIEKADFNFNNRKDKIKNLLEEEFPGIFDKNKTEINIIYSSVERIEQPHLQHLIRQTAEDLDSILSLDCKDEALSSILRMREPLITLKHATKLLNVIDKYQLKLDSLKKDSEAKEGLKKQLESLREEKNHVLDMGDKKRESVEEFTKSKQTLAKLSARFSDYVSYKEKSDEFIKNVGNLSTYWSVSFIKDEKFKIYKYAESDRLEEQGVRGGINDYYKILREGDTNLIESSLNRFIKDQGLEAKVNHLGRDPSSYRFPLWCMFLWGSFLPIIRNILIRTYMAGGRTYDEAYTFSSLAGLGNGFLGVIFLDGLHPLVFPARMLTPLVVQPLKKIFKVDV